MDFWILGPKPRHQMDCQSATLRSFGFRLPCRTTWKKAPACLKRRRAKKLRLSLAPGLKPTPEPPSIDLFPAYFSDHRGRHWAFPHASRKPPPGLGRTTWAPFGHRRAPPVQSHPPVRFRSRLHTPLFRSGGKHETPGHHLWRLTACQALLQTL